MKYIRYLNNKHVLQTNSTNTNCDFKYSSTWKFYWICCWKILSNDVNLCKSNRTKKVWWNGRNLSQFSKLTRTTKLFEGLWERSSQTKKKTRYLRFKAPIWKFSKTILLLFSNLMKKRLGFKVHSYVTHTIHVGMYWLFFRPIKSASA